LRKWYYYLTAKILQKEVKTKRKGQKYGYYNFFV